MAKSYADKSRFFATGLSLVRACASGPAGRIFPSMLCERTKRFFLSTVFAAWLSPQGFALGPHEILVLAHGSEPDSIEVAKAYARMRHVPDANVVVLHMPAWRSGQAPVIRPEDFTRLIWGPATQAAKARGIDDHILAWVYSTHFPIRIDSQPPVSLQGLTFMRNHMPESKAIGEGSYS